MLEIQLPTSPQLGLSEATHRLALAKLQVLWPMMVRFDITGTVYGHAEPRADKFGLDRREMLRWWADYKARGVLGSVPSGIQAKWKQWLPQLEPMLLQERKEWLEAKDTFFCDELRRVMASGRLGQRLTIGAALRQAWPSLAYDQEPRGTPAHGALGKQQASEVGLRIGVCREILLAPICSRRYTDAALNEYASDWWTSGATMRVWLDWYRAPLGARSVMPARLTSSQVEWLELVEEKVLALRSNDTRPQSSYWKALLGHGIPALAPGVASKALSGHEADVSSQRYESVRRRLMRYLAGTGRNRNNDLAGIAKAMEVSPQTITNWRNEWNMGKISPFRVTQSMAVKLDAMEAVMAALEEAAAAIAAKAAATAAK
jgi:hypothetical protein